jgi:hypothetical protein
MTKVLIGVQVTQCYLNRSAHDSMLLESANMAYQQSRLPCEWRGENLITSSDIIPF